MTTKTFTVHLYHSSLSYADDCWSMFASDRMADRYYTYVKPVEIEVEVPENFDPRPGKIAALQAEEEELRAAFAARVTEIQREISKLQAITYEAPEAA